MSAIKNPAHPVLGKMPTETVPEVRLPIISLSDETLSDPDKRKEEIEKIVGSFSSVGFCLVNGIKGYDTEKILKWMKWFFFEVDEKDK